jgi:hypothetical protein
MVKEIELTDTPSLDVWLAQTVLKNRQIPRRAWLIWRGKMDVYIRVTARVFDHGNERMCCIDIANVLTIESYRGQGLFWALIEHIKASYPHEYIVIESIHNKRLLSSLLNKQAELLPSDFSKTSVFLRPISEPIKCSFSRL